MYILMPDDIGYLKYKKQVYELKVGKAMYDWYGQQKKLLNTVRQVVVYSFLRYFDLLGLDPWMGAQPPAQLLLPCYVNLTDILPAKKAAPAKPKTNEVIKKLLEKEKFLLIWGREQPSTENLGKILTNYAKWSVNDCSELVRVWGGIVEEIGNASVKNELQAELGKGGGTAAEIAERLDDIRKRAKGQSKDFLTPAKIKGVTMPLNPRLKMVSDAHKKLALTEDGHAVKGGVRDRVAYAKEAREVPRFMRPYVFPGDKPIADIDKDDKSWVRGCSLLKPANPSLIKHLDTVFGLWEGADISGTTTDFMGCFEAVWTMVFDGVLAEDANTPQNVNAALEVMTWCFPYFALLAPSAMVYAYHHTMYEIGLALSLAYGGVDKDKAVFDYYIGFYDTLVPNITHSTSHIQGGHNWLKRAFSSKPLEPKWTVGKRGSPDRMVMESGRAEENRLKNTLAQAIQKVENDEQQKDKLANPCVVTLIDKKGVAYGGYLLSPKEKKAKKDFFQSTKVHEEVLKSSPSEYSKWLLGQIGGDVKKIAGLYYDIS